MKNPLFFLLLGISLASSAQDKITFDYDAAGNQIKRELCISCNKANYKAAVSEAENYQKFTPQDNFSYYPNPVQEELHLKWELNNGKAISNIYLYNLNGGLLKMYEKLENTNQQDIPFLDYPQGVYLLVLMYSNGEEKNIKIVK